jgi:FAD/FMN-containing dehydrogenase
VPRRTIWQPTDRIDGSVIEPGDRDWKNAVAVWNGPGVRTPAVMVRAASTSDVAATIEMGRRHRLLLSVKGGGHNLAGTAVADGALTLDLSGMRDIAVDPAGRRAQVGPGCRLGEVDRATPTAWTGHPFGLVSETGVPGLTLGGGFSYLTRRFGWPVDNLVDRDRHRRRRK